MDDFKEKNAKQLSSIAVIEDDMTEVKRGNANLSSAIATNNEIVAQVEKVIAIQSEAIAGIKDAIAKIESAPVYNTDEIAQGACVAMSSKGGWIYAVRKDCPGQWTCSQICGMASLKNQDPQVAPHRYGVSSVT